jgi:hypothetical protein
MFGCAGCSLAGRGGRRSIGLTYRTDRGGGGTVSMLRHRGSQEHRLNRRPPLGSSLGVAGAGVDWRTASQFVPHRSRSDPSPSEEAAEGLKSRLHLVHLIASGIRGEGLHWGPQSLSDSSCPWPDGLVEIGGVHGLAPHAGFPAQEEGGV